MHRCIVLTTNLIDPMRQRVKTTAEKAQASDDRGSMSTFLRIMAGCVNSNDKLSALREEPTRKKSVASIINNPINITVDTRLEHHLNFNRLQTMK